MTERVALLKKRLLSTKPSLCIERARIYTKAYQDNEALPKVRTRARALAETLQNMTIFIDEDELIVGNHASRQRAAPIFPEYAIAWITSEIDSIDQRTSEAYSIGEKEKTELKKICEYWKGRTLHERAESLLAPEYKAIHDSGIIRAEGNMTSGDGHIAPNYDKLLSLGLGGYAQLLQRSIAALDLSRWADLKKRQLYLAMLEAVEAASTFILRFEKLAREKGRACGNTERARELAEIADTCQSIAFSPPNNFRSALQLCYFIHLILQIESNGHSLSLGRMDQYLYPFYRASIDRGELDSGKVRELLCCTWLKLLAIKKVRSWAHTKYSAGGPLYQNVTIGGTNKAGEDAVNGLSFAILESVGHMKLTQPNLSVRYHKNMSDDFMNAALDVVRKGFGMPAFNNDEVVIPGMLMRGVTLEDARNYAAIGCIEVAVPGKWGYRTTGMSFLNLMRVFLATLRDGKDSTSGQTFLPGTGRLEDFGSFSDLMQAWKKQIAYYAKATVAIDTAVDTALEDLVPDILCSTFTDDCIERGAHIKEGGSVYDFVSGLQVGVANLGNALAAVRKQVFDDRSVSAAQLLAALDSNFEGLEGEKLRLCLLNLVPKYGNDNDYTDSVLVEAYDAFAQEIAQYHTTRYGRGPTGCGYYPGTSSISSNVPSGSVVPATPDGRKAGTPLAEGASPTSGTDTQGPTAVFKSVAKLDATKIFGGVLLNQKLAPSMLECATDRAKLIMLLRTFFDDLKGWHVQYNIVSKEVLLDAQAHPDMHRDLVVRVAGYSAYFNDLGSDQQNDIIARTEHTSLA